MYEGEILDGPLPASLSQSLRIALVNAGLLTLRAAALQRDLAGVPGVGKHGVLEIAKLLDTYGIFLLPNIPHPRERIDPDYDPAMQPSSLERRFAAQAGSDPGYAIAWSILQLAKAMKPPARSTKG